jgi:hypothetical protein
MKEMSDLVAGVKIAVGITVLSRQQCEIALKDLELKNSSEYFINGERGL